MMLQMRILYSDNCVYAYSQLDENHVIIPVIVANDSQYRNIALHAFIKG